jgi:hypothetical protein
MEEKLRILLVKTCKSLNRGDVSNFQVSIGLFLGKTNQVGNEEDSIREILGPSTVVGGVEMISLEQLLATVRECFEWRGDDAAHPNRRYQFSDGFSADVINILSDLRFLSTDALGIWEFWLSDGHPFYPVFWEFAFLIKKSTKNYVFIGSSSD